jgi:tripartite-type tricarboxylate transporter receptor subunit TctC
MRIIAWVTPLTPFIAFAQVPQTGWKPDRPVEIVIGAAAGGANDRAGLELTSDRARLTASENTSPP